MDYAGSGSCEVLRLGRYMVCPIMDRLSQWFLVLGS